MSDNDLEKHPTLDPVVLSFDCLSRLSDSVVYFYAYICKDTFGL